MRHFLYLLLLFAAPVWLTGAEAPPTILVSVAPYKNFVERIGGDTVNVMLMVPAGASAHTYEPTPKQVLAASLADLWFTIGESFEARVLPSLIAHHPGMETVDLRKGVDMITAAPGERCCCHADCQDLHIWLSPREAKVQVKSIAEALSRRYPQHAERYAIALSKLLSDLDALDGEIRELLQPLQRRMIFVSHPAYAYFCRDYGLRQLSVEVEGKDPTPQQLTRILNEVRAAGTKRIYIQPQYSNKGAKLFASELGATIVTLDPYSEHYFESMKEIARQFSMN